MGTECSGHEGTMSPLQLITLKYVPWLLDGLEQRLQCHELRKDAARGPRVHCPGVVLRPEQQLRAPVPT